MASGELGHTFVCLVHELEKLVHDCLEELPVRLEETWVLANDVHDVGRNNGLVVLATLDLAKPEEILDDRDQESLLRFLIWRLD